MKKWLNVLQMQDEYAKALLFVFWAALVIYTQQAWVPGFFHDGYLYAAFGRNAAEQGHWLIPHLSQTTYDQFYQHSPFIFILEGLFFKIFGSSYTSARWFAALFMLATLGLLMRMIWREKQQAWALISGALFVFIPPLMKKARFPNLDLPLMLFTLSALYYYWRAFLENKPWQWLLTGVFFGLALLTKGPMGAFIPIAICLHLVVSGQLKRLLSLMPWLSLILGFILFAMWPLALWQAGRWDIFSNYLQSTFIHTISEGRGAEETKFFTYVIFLMKQALPWCLLALWSGYQWFKTRKEPTLTGSLWLLFACYLIPKLVLLSLTTFKYSHYLIPLYPALAAMAALPLASFSQRFFENFFLAIRGLVLAGTLALLSFPLTTKITRDPPLHEALALAGRLQMEPTGVAIVDRIWPFFGTANLMAYAGNKETVDIHKHQLETWLKGDPNWQAGAVMDKRVELNQFKWMFLAPVAVVNELEQKYPQEMSDRLRKLAMFEKYQMVVLVETSLWAKDQPLIFKN